MVYYYLATLFVLSLDSNISGLHVNLLARWTYIGGAGHDSMIGCSIWVVSISPLPWLRTWISLVWWRIGAIFLLWTSKICLKEEERSGVDHSFKKNYICLSDISRCCLIYSFKQVVRNSLATFSIKKLECLYLWVYGSTSATFIVITLSISMQTGMLDFSGTAQKVQLVQH